MDSYMLILGCIRLTSYQLSNIPQFIVDASIESKETHVFLESGPPLIVTLSVLLV